MNYSKLTERSEYLYILRRTLPPWCWRENLDELVEYCQKYKIDEVCVKIDTGTFTHYFPDFEWLENYQKILMTIKKELNAIGVEYSLNPNITQGHGDRGRNIWKQHPDWNMITDYNGIKCLDCACNASVGWREYIKKQWTIYAETKPATIWIEDDLRTFGHGPVSTGCFCDEHIRRFNEYYNKNLTRTEIYKATFAKGKPTETRRQWLKLLNIITCEMVALAKETVHAVSPETFVGLMSSGPHRHTAEGRDWKELHHILAENNNLMLSRPPAGNYREFDLTSLQSGFDVPRLTRHALGAPTIDEGEIESYPYSTYNKSNVYLRLQNIAAMAAGCDALTLNLFDHCGTPMAVNRDTVEALRDMKPFLTGIKKQMVPRGNYKGIQLYFNSKTGLVCELDNETGDISLESCVMAWSAFIQNSGVSITYDDAYVTVLAGQDIRAASDAEIKKMLSEGLLLDATAFKTLSSMGYSKYLGGKLKSELKLGQELPLAGEHFYNSDFGGKKNHYFSLAIQKSLPLFIEIEHDIDVIEITEIVDPDIMRIFGGAYLYENELGGRIAIYPFEVSKLVNGFLDPTRKKMLYQILNWISNDEIPLFMEGEREVLPLRCDFENYLVAMFFNLSHDNLIGISAKMYIADKEIKNAFYLTQNGEWMPFMNIACEDNKVTLNIEELTFDQPLFVTVNFKR